MIARSFHNHSSGSASWEDFDVVAICGRLGEPLDRLTATLQRVCGESSHNQAKKTFTDLCEDWDNQVFFWAWPTMLSRDSMVE